MSTQQKILLNAVLENIQSTFHEPDGLLTYPYLDPGGVYSKSLWDWDSFWTLKGLLGIAEKTNDDSLKQQVIKYGSGAINNFFKYQGPSGSLSILMNDKDSDCFDCHSSENKNMAKPFFGQFCKLIAENLEEGVVVENSENWCACLDKFYACYEKRYIHKQTGLYLWANDVAIGVDDDPSTWGRPPFSSANIYLNCFLYADLRAAAKFAKKYNNNDLANKWTEKAVNLANAIQEFCWDERDGMFYSVDVQCQQNLSKHRIFGELNINLKPFWNVIPVKIMSWVSFLPLWCGIATEKQAARMVKDNLMNENRFLAKWGIRSLSADEKMYSPAEKRGNPSNWLGPIWIISNYIIWSGLEKYDYKKEAKIISQKVIQLLVNDYEKNNLLHENYNPETGEGIAAPGFWNWNILACSME